MADDRHYVPGDFYRICDRTGFKVRAGRTRKEWTGRIVRTKSFEMRQPQDLVRGVPDWQAVPDPRPRQANQFINQYSGVGPSTSTTSFPSYVDEGGDAYVTESGASQYISDNGITTTQPGANAPTGEIQVYGDSPLGTEFLVQNQKGPAYNTGTFPGTAPNPGGTADYQQINGTIPAVTPASLNQSLNRGPGAE